MKGPTRRRFLLALLESADRRLERCRAELLRPPGPEAAGALAAELHTLAGEAAMVGCPEIAALALEAEAAAREAETGACPEPWAACRRLVDALAAATAALASGASLGS